MCLGVPSLHPYDTALITSSTPLLLLGLEVGV